MREEIERKNERKSQASTIQNPMAWERNDEEAIFPLLVRCWERGKTLKRVLCSTRLPCSAPLRASLPDLNKGALTSTPRESTAKAIINQW